MNPSQGVRPWPSVESYFHRGAGGGLTIWYSGAVNQTAHGSTNFTAGNLYAHPVILPGGVIDTIAFECTALGAGSAARVGIYSNTSEQVIYPSSLVVDGGEQDTTSVGVKSTAGLSIAISPGLYWFCYLCRATAPFARFVPLAAMSHVSGALPTMGANLPGSIVKVSSYGALPSTFPSGGAISGLTVGALVAVHYAS